MISGGCGRWAREGLKHTLGGAGGGRVFRVFRVFRVRVFRGSNTHLGRLVEAGCLGFVMRCSDHAQHGRGFEVFRMLLVEPLSDS